MNILACYDKTGPKLHRILMPVHLMECEVKVTFIPTEEELEWCDILFFNRMIPDTKIEDIRAARSKYGFKVVCDLDDHWILGPEHILYETYQHYKISEIIEKFMRMADIVTVTHDRLQKQAKIINPVVHVLPNAIAKTDQFDIVKYPSPVTRLFWAGGVTHRKDLAILKGPSRRINSELVSWVLGGYQKEPEWDAMASTYTNGGRFRHQVINSLPVQEYYKVYAHCDISLVPLIDNAFNSFKSNLKILEAANIAAPVVVSRVHPYLGFPEDIVNYVDTQADWYMHVKRLVRDPEKRKAQGIALAEYCHEHYNFDKINEQRKHIFDAAIQHRQPRAVQAEV